METRTDTGEEPIVDALFEPWEAGTLKARNRIVRAATYRGLATEDGRPTPDLVRICRDLASGGAGTIVTGYARVLGDEAANPRMLGAFDDKAASSLAPLVERAHADGAAIVLQIAHGGSASRPAADASSHVNQRIIGPSAVENPKRRVTPEEAKPADIERVAAAFADAAVRAKAVGFDGVEVHAGHGYLLSQFLSPALNRRTDAWGGTIENRARLAGDIVRAVRDRTGSFPVFVKMNSSDGSADGLSEDDALAAARIFARAGADAIEVSGAWRAFDATAVRNRAGEPFFAAFACRLVRALREDAEKAGRAMPAQVILTGGVRDARRAAELISENGIAAVGLSRPLICEPDLPRRWQADAAYRPRCVSCNGCSSSAGCACVLPSM